MKIIILLLLLSFQSVAQSEANACKTISKIKDKIIEFHYKPKPINDSLSAFVFKTFIKNIDNGNDLFLASEINALKKHQFQIDNYIRLENCTFLADFYETYEKAIKRKKAIINKVITDDFTFSSNKKIIFYKKSKPHLKTEIDLIKLFKKRLLFDVLGNIAETSQNKDSITKNFEQISQKSKQKIFDYYLCQANSNILAKQDFYDTFFNIFCNYFDPHTNYFSKNDKTKFLSSVSSDNFSFGLEFIINDGNKIIIADLTPGGAAFFLDDLEIGDELIKIKSTEEINVNCNNFDAIEKILSSNEIRKVIFTFRKKNNVLYHVNIVKQIVKDYQNSVFSFILERDNHKTGYIKIPSFYATLEYGKTNVSDDVKKEIFKLKEDNVNGLIIDLENNGGGSMQEAIKLCGLFLNTIYLGQEINKSRNKTIIGNEIYKPIYQGPIVIIINGYSASASEFFANAMQDYNVAIIVGSKSFGKASYQQIIPLDNSEQEFVKITLGKFYRVTGKTNQYSGLEPNIILSNIFDDQINREKDYKTALKNDVISSVVNLDKFPKNEKQKLAIVNFNKSSFTNERFLKNMQIKNRFNQLYKNTLPPLSLQFNDVFNKLKLYSDNWKEIENYTKSMYPFEISNTQYDLNTMKINSNLKLISEKQIKNLKTNYVVYEAMDIIKMLK